MLRMAGETAILVVEDETLILLDVEAGLIDAGFEVMTACNGAKALDQFGAGPGHIKALITDIRLGNGANGWDVARHCRQMVPNLPVIYMSADSGSAWSAQGVPGSVMINKPFVMAQVITALSTLLNEAGQLEAVTAPPAADAG